MRIFEIVKTIQGEGTHAGRPCHLIRFAGCNLRCAYCDTPAALPMDAGEQMSLDQVVDAVDVDACKLALITGGEPLVQADDCRDLCDVLHERGFEVLLETNGSLDWQPMDARVVKIVDVKTPSSGEVDRNRADLLTILTDRDEIKFVLGDEADYRWACQFVAANRDAWEAQILFGPVDTLAAAELAGWILRDDIAVRLQIQLHKILRLP